MKESCQIFPEILGFFSLMMRNSKKWAAKPGMEILPVLWFVLPHRFSGSPGEAISAFQPELLLFGSSCRRRRCRHERYAG